MKVVQHFVFIYTIYAAKSSSTGYGSLLLNISLPKLALPIPVFRNPHTAPTGNLAQVIGPILLNKSSEM